MKKLVFVTMCRHRARHRRQFDLIRAFGNDPFAGCQSGQDLHVHAVIRAGFYLPFLKTLPFRLHVHVKNTLFFYQCRFGHGQCLLIVRSTQISVHVSARQETLLCIHFKEDGNERTARRSGFCGSSQATAQGFERPGTTVRQRKVGRTNGSDFVRVLLRNVGTDREPFVFYQRSQRLTGLHVLTRRNVQRLNVAADRCADPYTAFPVVFGQRLHIQLCQLETVLCVQVFALAYDFVLCQRAKPLIICFCLRVLCPRFLNTGVQAAVIDRATGYCE